MIFHAYIIACITTGKEYVGITGNTKRRWSAHRCEAARNKRRVPLHAAIRKYGPDKFTFATIAEFSTWKEACDFEIREIASRGTVYPKGYNYTLGGEGAGGMLPETRKRITLANIGRKHTPESKALISAASRNRVVSEHTKILLSLAHKGKSLSIKHRQNLSAAKIGRAMPTRSSEHKARISLGLKAAWEKRKSNGLLQRKLQ